MNAWPGIVIVVLVSAFLCRELAKKYHRDSLFYFVVGGLIGPLGILVVMTPLPIRTVGVEEDTVVERPLRVIEKPECPACHYKVFPGEHRCDHCGQSLDVPWWERTRSLQGS